MFFIANTLDDLLNEVLEKLVNLPFDITASRGTTSEIFGVLLQLNNPRARLSRTETKGTPFSALGELLWYLSKSNSLDFIEYYIQKYRDNSDDGLTIHGGYGPRFFNMHGQYDQISNIVDLLKGNPSSRRAVIQLIDARDTQFKDNLNAEKKRYKDIPCTCSIQFAIRDNKLHMFTHMRSNDAFIGLPHDIFSFTMLQEIIARVLNIELGYYHHAIGSLHLYKENRSKALDYLKEGFQSTKDAMPEMPLGNPWPSIEILMDAEAKIRSSNDIDISMFTVDNYWIDLIHLLQIHSLFKINDVLAIANLQKEMSSPLYNTYIENRIKKVKEAAQK